MKRWVCALVCAALTVTPFGSARAAEQRAVLTLRINTVTKQDATVTLRDDDVLVRRGDLIAAGLKAFPFERTGSDGDLISLAALKPDVTFHIDDVALALDLTVAPNHLDATVVDFRSKEDVSLARPVKSAFLNYSAGASSDTGVTLAGEFGTHIGAGVFSSTMSYASSRLYRSSVTRWIVDSPSADRRMTIGDVLTQTGDFGSTVSIAGFGVQRYFGLNSNMNKTALPQISGNALTPSTADVYVNGVLERHEILPPGQFSFQDLPVGEGPNTTSIVITDAFGRQQTYSNYFYGSDTLLPRGVSDFSYGAGVLHSEFGEQTGHGAAAAGRYALGVTDNITAGGRLEMSGSLVSAGPNISLRLHRGVLAAAAAVSREGQASGTAALMSFQYMSRRATGAFSLSLQSPHYASLGLPASQDRPLLNAALSIAEQLTKDRGIGFSYVRENDRDSGAESSLQAFQTSMLSRSTQMQVTESLSSGSGHRHFGIAATVNFMPGNGLNASVTAADTGGATTTSLQIQRSAGAQTPSLGYTIAATGGAGAMSGFLSADYRGQYGNYLADVGVAPGSDTFSATAGGGLVFIGGKIYATQPITDSYALVDTGGLAHVRILANNVVAGRTDKHGFLVIPALGSYYNNDITIAPQDTPLNYSIDTQTQRLAPMYRSGGVVRFGVNQVKPVTGALLVRFGNVPQTPAFGILEVRTADTVVTSDIGENGEFYFDKLPPGTHPAIIKFKGGECRFDLSVPQTQSLFVKLGTISCSNGVHS